MTLLTFSHIAEKFLKFCIVGGSGVLVDFGLTYLCKERWKLNKYLANSIGFTTAATTNYILNRIWTFASHNKEIVREYLSFFIISIIGLLINNLIIWLLNDKIKVNFYLAKVGAIAFVTFWNFIMNYLFTFPR